MPSSSRSRASLEADWFLKRKRGFDLGLDQVPKGLLPLSLGEA